LTQQGWANLFVGGVCQHTKQQHQQNQQANGENLEETSNTQAFILAVLYLAERRRKIVVAYRDNRELDQFSDFTQVKAVDLATKSDCHRVHDQQYRSHH
jgi:hypothetical protein